VFSIETPGLHARSLAEKISKDTYDLKKRLKSISYVEGIEVENYKKPYLGVTAFLNEFRNDDGSPLFPIFIPENYWEKRMLFWTDRS
jgi:hypothetical protein